MSDNIIPFHQQRSTFFSSDTSISDPLDSIIESLLLAAERPISPFEISEWTETDESKVRQTLRDMQDGLKLEQRGFTLIETESGWQFQTNPRNAKYVQKMLAIEPNKLSKASLETLAIIAYEQPITKSDIDQLRQRDCSAVIKNLLDLSLIHILGKKQEIGSPLIYGTTSEFLDLFGIRDLIQLPRLEDLASLQQTNENRISKKMMPQRVSLIPTDSETEIFGFSDWEIQENVDSIDSTISSNVDDSSNTSPLRQSWLFNADVFSSNTPQRKQQNSEEEISDPKGNHNRFSFQHMFLQTGNRDTEIQHTEITFQTDISQEEDTSSEEE